MSFDQDMRNRFAQQAPTVTNLEGGAASAAQSAGRRTAATRGLVAIAMVALVGLGAVALTLRGNNNAAEVATEINDGQVEAPADNDDTTTGELDDTTDPADDGEIEGGEAEDVTPEVVPPGEPSEPAPDETPTEPVVPIVDGSVFRIQNVAPDDTLNARSGPGTDNGVVFEFASDATGVVRTDTEAVSIGSSVWIEVFAPTAGDQTTEGWVNSSFLGPIDVPDSRSCLFNGPQDNPALLDVTNSDGSPDVVDPVVTTIETFRFGACLRTIIDFSDGFTGGGVTPNRLTALPNDIVVTSDGTIDFGAVVNNAQVADARYVESSGIEQSMFIQRTFEGTLRAEFFTPTDIVQATFDNENGRIVIDSPDSRSSIVEDQGPLFDDGSIILTDVVSEIDDRRWTFSGMARPFEAFLPIEVVADGQPLEVQWVGFETERASSNGLMVTSWLEWGLLEFTIELDEGVEAADVVVRFETSGGAADEPQYTDIALVDFLS